MKRGLVFGAMLTLMLCFLPAQVQAQGPEYLIVSGGPALSSFERLRYERDRHDKWHFNFIRPARVTIEKLQQKHGKNAMITWLVYRPGYENRQREDGEPHLRNIESVRDKYGIKLVWFSTGDEVINYLNRGQNRGRIKIGSFEYFGHSNRHCFMFDYSSEILGVSKAYLHETQLEQINRGIFLPTATVKSWGCHTAESMSAKWRKCTGVKMWGAIGKTDYADMHANGWMPRLGEGASWRF